MKRLFLFLLLLFAVQGYAQTTVPVKPQQPGDTALNTFQQFKMEAKEAIRDNEKRIERLHDKLLRETEEAKAALREKVDSLQAKNNRLKADLNAYKEDKKQDWRTFRRNFEHEMDKLRQSFEELKGDLE